MKNKPIKVCMLTTSFPRWEGDYAATFIYDLCRKLYKKRVKVIVVAPHDVGTQTHEEMDGIEVNRFQYMWLEGMQKLAYGGGIPHNLRTNFYAKCQLPFFLWLFFRKGARIAKKCNVIHAHWTLSGFIGVFMKKFLDKPLVLTVHGSDVNYLPKSGIMLRLAKFTFENCEKIIAVSSALKHKLVDLGVSESKIELISNGVDIKLFSPVGETVSENNLLWVGRMTEEKGLKYLVEAMAAIADRGQDVKLTLIGDGDLQKDLEKHAENMGVRDNINFKGRKPHMEIPSYLHQAKLVVLPSLSEGLPLTLLEAMATERAVIATDVGGIPDIVKDGYNGFLVEQKNPKQLAERILYLIEHREVVERMGKEGRKMVEEKYTWEKIAGKTLEVYVKVMK